MHQTKKTNGFAMNYAKRKTNRKMKGGFFWNRNKSAPNATSTSTSTSKQPTSEKTIAASTIVKTSTAVAITTTLVSMASDYLADPSTILAITGFASTSIAISSCGFAVVGLLVLRAAWMIVKERKRAYKGLVLVMDELYLVIQKLNGIVEVSMHIANTYGFPMDMRDVQIALDTIIRKIDELLDPTTDYPQIKQSLSNFKKLRTEFNEKRNEVQSELANASEEDDLNDPPTISIWTSAKNTVSNAYSAVSKSFKKNIIFSAPKFVQELNEDVAYLALYVGIFSSSFSTTYTTVTLQLLANGKTDELKKLQSMVFTDSTFISMVEGAIVFPLLQSQKTHETCVFKSPSSAASCDLTFYKTAENVLKDMKRIVSPDNDVLGGLYVKMNNLKKVIDNTSEITSAESANAFAVAVKNAFDADKAAITQAAVPQNAIATATAVATTAATTSIQPTQPEAVAAQPEAVAVQPEAVAAQPEAVAAPSATPTPTPPTPTPTPTVATPTANPMLGPRRSDYPTGDDGYAAFEKAQQQFQTDRANQRKVALAAQPKPSFMKMQSGPGVLQSQEILPERPTVTVTGGSRTIRRGVQKNRHNAHSRKIKSKY